MRGFEQDAWARGIGRLAGLDEAGRGPLAGPVVAAALCIPRGALEDPAVLTGVRDSKQLTAAAREAAYAAIVAVPGAVFGIGMADVEEIDRLNILRATHLAMARALAALPELPELVLVDGLPVPGLPCPSQAIVKGDARSVLIAGASIVAKVTRDRMLVDLDARYPLYGFAGHKGYGSRRHMEALLEHGPCPAHRRSFAPVRDAERIRHMRDVPGTDDERA